MNYRRWAEELVELGQEMTEKRTLAELLSSILNGLRRLTGSDAGTIYRMTEEEGEDYLIFEAAQNDSVDFSPKQGVRVDVGSGSLAGYVAETGEVLNIEDAYKESTSLPCEVNREFDKKFNYRTKSILVVPLKNRVGRVRGVLQLINKKAEPDCLADETEILPYPESKARLVLAAASQAALALERATLERQVQEMLEGLIATLVSGIERRDKVTSGHSQRLAEYAVKTAEVIHQLDEGRWEEVEFEDEEITALHYAALTHDIGKLAVPEEILLKDNRLSDECMSALEYRLAYLESINEIEDMQQLYEQVREANRAHHLSEELQDKIKQLAEITVELPSGETQQLLTAEEYDSLLAEKGTLTAEEWEQMREHPMATYEILQQVNWTEGLEEVPWLASLHHEKLNGEGYPRGLKGEEIPLRARILAAVDIYEALTATDRPYKKPLSDDRAQKILQEEAAAGAIDRDVVEVFFDHVVGDSEGLTEND